MLLTGGASRPEPCLTDHRDRTVERLAPRTAPQAAAMIVRSGCNRGVRQLSPQGDCRDHPVERQIVDISKNEINANTFAVTARPLPKDDTGPIDDAFGGAVDVVVFADVAQRDLPEPRRKARQFRWSVCTLSGCQNAGMGLTSGFNPPPRTR